MSLKMRPAGEITIALRNTTTGLPASPCASWSFFGASCWPGARCIPC